MHTILKRETKKIESSLFSMFMATIRFPFIHRDLTLRNTFCCCCCKSFNPKCFQFYLFFIALFVICSAFVSNLTNLSASIISTPTCCTKWVTFSCVSVCVCVVLVSFAFEKYFDLSWMREMKLKSKPHRKCGNDVLAYKYVLNYLKCMQILCVSGLRWPVCCVRINISNELSRI